MTAESTESGQGLGAVLLHCPELEQYHYPKQCPFRSERAGMLRKTLVSMGLLPGPDRAEIAPTPATRDDLAAFHTPRYLDVLQKAPLGYLDIEGLTMGLGTDETPIFLGLFEHACWAAGASLTGARLLLEGRTEVAFNPSGGFHHAHRSLASGFCYVNDVVLACGLLAGAGKRVACLDIDAHHGDGTQAAFYDRRDVLTISMHESGQTLFPGTGFADEIGEGEGEGFCANVPLPAGTDDPAFARAFDSVAMPLLQAYQPDVIVMELGMDMLAGDPLTHLELTNNAYADAVEKVLSLPAALLAVGGGGYNVENAVRGWALAWTVFCGEQDAEEDLLMGLGGVMMASTDWQAGLRDRQRAVGADQRQRVDRAVDDVIARARECVFRYHGL